MNTEIKNMLALVTGATSGMGLEYCRQLAQRGCDILMVSNQQEMLATLPMQLAEEYGVRVVGYYQDLALKDAAQELFDWCENNGEVVDILVNNAGMYFFHELSPEYYPKANAMLMLHVVTPTRLCMLFGEKMKQRRRGFIINVSSLTAKVPAPGITMYAATKAYLKSFSKSLYFEMRPYGVGVTTVIPGAIATPLYNINDKMMKVALKIGLIKTPQWLVRRAIRGTLRRRHYVKPGAMNYYLPMLVKSLPNWLEDKIWKWYVKHNG